MDYRNELSKYIENIDNLKEHPVNATDFEIDTEDMFGEYFAGLTVYSISMYYNEENGEYGGFTCIAFIYDQIENELKKFVDDIKNDKFAVFYNLKENIEPYYDDYPKILIAYPYNNMVRFIMVKCSDWGRANPDEKIYCDILITKESVADQFDKLIKEIEKINPVWKKEAKNSKE